MPAAPPKPCKVSRCPGLTTNPNGFCDKHQDRAKEKRRAQDKYRGSAAARGYDRRWRQYRERFLRRNPLCAECMRRGRATPATVVDHIVPHRGDQRLFWQPENHQPLCKPCHDRKTAAGG